MMRRAVLALALLAALGATGSASAGCWATVELLSPAPAVHPGETWRADLRVLQHGRTPLPDATPTVVISNPETGETRSFAADLIDGPGSRFGADVVFPTSGEWIVAANDGFPHERCAQTHILGTHAIAAGGQPPPASGGGDGASLALPLGLGLGLGLGALALAATLRARGGRRPRAA